MFNRASDWLQKAVDYPNYRESNTMTQSIRCFINSVPNLFPF